ncbi:NADPH-dependent FMN reductase [Pseudoxanthomonas dokdonensis]|uniref:NADPH-dependent FMN reductase n=1 Tax=Pseudoxanthomonas dokdonensis TaxID=344882 RepID=A0A0R0CSE9_9GAMM|nr:NADPH-dependent FMN reductase [Pseudoxanthomonas dokdonensis]KRG68830.1 NADPH-dependent FMN reductase [Pseudoxanthomonas dokdonensis]
MEPIKLVVIVGSLRKASINRKLATALERMLPDGIQASRAGIGELPLYNQEYDADFPAPATAFKAAIEAADALLFVTPEYNHSIPGVLKNAIDFASRPAGRSSFGGKLAAIAGASPGRTASALSQQHLRNVLAAMGVLTMPTPEALVQFSEGLIDDEGRINDERTRTALQKFIDSYVQWLQVQLRR